MKVWASASAIGLSLAYFSAGCSSEPPTDQGYVPVGGTSSSAGTGTSTSGTGTTGGSAAGGSSSGGDTSTAGTPAAGTGGAAGGAGGGAGGTGGTGMAADCPEGVDGHCKAGVEYPAVPGYTLKLVEEFDAPIDLNADPIWTWSDGNPADGQTGFREQNIKFEGGYMTLTAEKPEGCTPAENDCIDGRDSFGEAQAPGVKATIGPMGVWSGELRSKYNNYRYGRYEVKMIPPNVPAGNFLSTMFIFRTPKNVVWNEIDIELEPWKGKDQVYGNAVNFTGPGNAPVGYPNDPARNDAWQASPGSTFDMYTEHVYAFNWTPEKIEWFVDGVSIHSFTGEPQNLISTKSGKIMMNLWVFGSSAAFGDPSKNVFPMVAKYDWFRFYKLDSDATYPCVGTPACLPADDKTASSQNNPKEVNYGK